MDNKSKTTPFDLNKKAGGISSGLLLLARPSRLLFRILRARPWSQARLGRQLVGSKRVDHPGCDAGVILAHPAKVRPQIFHLDRANIEVVVVFVIDAAAQGHRKAIGRRAVGTHPVAAEEHLAERVPFPVAPVRDARPKQVIDVVCARRAAIAEVPHYAQPVAQVVSQVCVEAVAACAPGQVFVFVPREELRFRRGSLGHRRSGGEQSEHDQFDEITHFSSSKELDWQNCNGSENRGWTSSITQPTFASFFVPTRDSHNMGRFCRSKVQNVPQSRTIGSHLAGPIFDSACVVPNSLSVNPFLSMSSQLDYRPTEHDETTTTRR